jgi:hypothetical protein
VFDSRSAPGILLGDYKTHSDDGTHEPTSLTVPLMMAANMVTLKSDYFGTPFS